MASAKLPILFSRICSTCGKDIVYANKANYQRAVEVGSPCRGCKRGELNKAQPKSKENNPSWKGYKGVGYNWFSKYFERGGRHRTGSITIEDAYNKLEEQGFRCALTGVPLAWDAKSGMSIDRIDSSEEYTLDNIQIVHKDVNLMKNAFDQTYFINMCKLVAKHK